MLLLAAGLRLNMYVPICMPPPYTVVFDDRPDFGESSSSGCEA